MSPAALGEMIAMGFRPADLDVMDSADMQSWRAVMAIYDKAVTRNR